MVAHGYPSSGETDMDVRWDFRRLGKDELERVAVGDPDPTSDPGTANGHQACRFEWSEISQTLILLWCCTRELGHQNQHVAGTGERVAAVHSPLSLTRYGTEPPHDLEVDSRCPRSSLSSAVDSSTPRHTGRSASRPRGNCGDHRAENDEDDALKKGAPERQRVTLRCRRRSRNSSPRPGVSPRCGI